MSSLKLQATNGMIWSALDKFAVQGGQFIVGIILARLLIPEDFGLIAMLSVFIAISQTFIESGMGSGLIQKKIKTDVDFSTVFVFNIVVSFFLYSILFTLAPFISEFYEKPQLVLLTRVLSLNIIINSLAIVQQTKLIIKLDFKTIAKVNVVSVLSGGLVAVYFAFTGWGVWALVIQNLVRAFVSVVMFWILSHWKPSIMFSKQSFKALFGFGSKLLISGLYATGLNEIYNITIGKVYSASELGYYTRSKQFAEVSSGTVTGIIQQVTYPILASIQDDNDRLVSVYRRLIKMTAFLVFPAMTLLALLAHPFIIVLLTDKWAPAIVLLQWLCFARVVIPINALNMNILNAVGRSDLFLKVDLAKAPIIIATLIITIPMGVKALVIGNVIHSFISFFINAYMPGKLFKYGAIQQIKDLIPIFIATGIMSIAVFVVRSLFTNYLIQLSLGLVIAIVTYTSVSHFLKSEELKELISLLIKKRTNKNL